MGIESSREPKERALAELVRYGVVGLLSNLASYLMYLLVVRLGVEPKHAMTFMYAIGAGIGFVGNRSWTFSYQGGSLSAGIRYCLAHLCGYCVNLALLLTFVDRFGFPHQQVQAVAILVVAGLLFLSFRYFVFPHSVSCRGGCDERLT